MVSTKFTFYVNLIDFYIYVLKSTHFLFNIINQINFKVIHTSDLAFNSFNQNLEFPSQLKNRVVTESILYIKMSKFGENKLVRCYIQVLDTLLAYTHTSEGNVYFLSPLLGAPQKSHSWAWCLGYLIQVSRVASYATNPNRWCSVNPQIFPNVSNFWVNFDTRLQFPLSQHCPKSNSFCHSKL